MKFDPQKAFPYPVLTPYSDDYDGPEFISIVDYKSSEGSENINFDIIYDISSEEILKEVESGNAVFVSLIMCRDTYFRYFLESSALSVKASIHISKLRGEVQVLSYVIAKQPISSFHSNDINQEFGDGPFKFERGDVLAQDEPDVFFIDRDLLKPVSSVFDLVKNDELTRTEWEVLFDQDHVNIALSPEMKEKIDNARNNATNKSILLNSIYFAAVMEAINQLKQDDTYECYKWARVIRRQATNKHVDILSLPLYKSASILMQYPLSYLDTYVFKESD